jgi:hypothetical protein
MRFEPMNPAPPVINTMSLPRLNSISKEQAPADPDLAVLFVGPFEIHADQSLSIRQD